MKSLLDNSKLSTREVILDAIKLANEATVEYLAEAADVSPVTVRHHLNSLQAVGLLDARSVRRKVGRPYYVYRLTDKGNELFPQRYIRLNNLLIEELKQQLPPEKVNEIFTNVVEKIVEEHRASLDGLSFEEKLDYLIDMLEDEGFLATWESNEGKYLLTEYSCPYYSVGQQHSEVCVFDKQLMIKVLDMPVNQHSCVLDGDSSCQFTIENPKIGP